MVMLVSCEILDELKKLGVENPEEIKQFVDEYTSYCTPKQEEETCNVN